MKAMRVILVLVYVLLIILLLLGLLTTCFRSCSLPDLPERDVRNIGGNGDVKVTLQWDFYADIDLHVTDPAGEEIDYTNTSSRSGGELDVDNQDGGSGAAENVFWESNPPRGNYQVDLVYYAEKSSTPKEGTCRVTVLLKDQDAKVYEVHMSPESERVHVTDFTY